MVDQHGSAFERIVSRLERAQETSKGARACCPAHEDHTPSLDIDRGDDGRVLLKCRSAGCSPQAIVEALGMSMADLFPEKANGDRRSGKTGGKKKALKRHETLQSAVGAAHWASTDGKKDGKVTLYQYTDASGEVIGAVVRIDFDDGRKKELRRVSRDGDAWLCRDIPQLKPLYRRHKLNPDVLSHQILVVEGEKCVDTLEQLGLTATTSMGGAKAALRQTDWSPLARQRIVILPDNDNPGREYGNAVAHHVQGADAASVRVLHLDGLDEGEDVHDWIEQRRSEGKSEVAILDELTRLLADAEDFTAATVEELEDEDSADKLGIVPLGQRDPESGRIVLSPKRTLPTALAYCREFATHNGHRTIFNYADVLWLWRGNRYKPIEDSSYSQHLQRWLHEALRYVYDKRTDRQVLANFESNPGTVSSALKALRAEAFLPATTSVPAWLGDSPSPAPISELLMCRTLTLHMPTRRVIGPTPLLFNVSALAFDYDPGAPEPLRWYAFLKGLFGDDLESIGLLQEWFGYCLTADTSQQKMLLLIGPRRSGKGTIARVFAKLVGADNVVGPTVGSLSGNFGLQPLLGKTLAIISDARFAGENVATVVERLLCISGEDAISIDRKFLPSVTTKLPVRFMFLTNELPKFNDSSTALAGRFLLLKLTQSFYGMEDTGLTEALNAELPGILLWAIEGWHRLRDRGRFLEPESSRSAIQDIEDLSSPVGAFVRERCVVGPGHRAACADLYQEWLAWCSAGGRTSPSTAQAFGRELSTAVPGVCRRRGTRMAPFYDGIGLSLGGQP